MLEGAGRRRGHRFFAERRGPANTARDQGRRREFSGADLPTVGRGLYPRERRGADLYRHRLGRRHPAGAGPQPGFRRHRLAAGCRRIGQSAIDPDSNRGRRHRAGGQPVRRGQRLLAARRSHAGRHLRRPDQAMERRPHRRPQPVAASAGAAHHAAGARRRIRLHRDLHPLPGRHLASVEGQSQQKGGLERRGDGRQRHRRRDRGAGAPGRQHRLRLFRPRPEAAAGGRGAEKTPTASLRCRPSAASRPPCAVRAWSTTGLPRG